MTQPLSPATQAIADAAYAAWITHDDPRSIAAATLCAAADQGENFYDPHEGKTSAVRTDRILDIAAELEGQAFPQPPTQPITDP